MKKNNLIIYFLFILIYGCIGEDFINDYVTPSLRFTNPILEIREGGNYQFIVRFFDESGTEVDNPILNWTVVPPNALSISADGTISTIQEGEVTIIVQTLGLQGDRIEASTQFTITPSPSVIDIPETATTTSTTSSNTIVGDTSSTSSGTSTSSATTTETTVTNSNTNHNSEDNGVVVAAQTFEGQIRSTSSYLLEGNYIYEHTGTNVLLSLNNNYKASTALPGLYIYLGNNPNTTEGAYEIGPVTVFQGAHEYSLPSSIALMDYQYILYWCKPFNVKVGEAQLFD